jgi:DNA-binding NtrC family response regulator
VKSFGERRLLIVEDDLDTLQVLQVWAEQLGCEVRTAESADRALELSARFNPTVVITDYMLDDDLTGVDLIVRLRRLGSDMTCVLITGVLHEALRESLNRIHGVIILAKPVNFDRLRQIVATA